MSTQKVKIVRDKVVIVTVYIDRRPQMGGGSLNSRNPGKYQHGNEQRLPLASRVVNGNTQHINHQGIKQKLETNGYKKDIGCKNMNRKAELLMYSHHLRESAKTNSKPSFQSKTPTISSSNSQHLPKEIFVNMGKRPKESWYRTCLGCSVPNLCRTLTSSQDKKEMKNREKRKLTGEKGYRIEAFMKIMRLTKMK